MVASRPLAGRVGLVALLTIWPLIAQAQGPPINTQNAFVTGLNGAGFRTFFLGFDRSGLRLEGNKVADPLDRQVRVRGQMFVLPYELLSNRLVVMGMLPYLNKTLEMGQRGTSRSWRSTVSATWPWPPSSEFTSATVPTEPLGWLSLGGSSCRLVTTMP